MMETKVWLTMRLPVPLYCLKIYDISNSSHQMQKRNS